MQNSSGKKEESNADHWDRPLFDSYLDVTHKLNYILKPKNYDKQSEDTCIICKIVNKDESIQRFEIFRNNLFIVFLNLFPYTPGHLMISPIDHKINYEEFTPQEIQEFGILTQRCTLMLKHFARTESFNVGWNQGPFSGGSIVHFHIHIVPRYKNELNFIEIIARSKPVVVTLEDTENYLLKYQEFLAGDKTLEELFEK